MKNVRNSVGLCALSLNFFDTTQANLANYQKTQNNSASEMTALVMGAKKFRDNVRKP
jgi:hypothetical protein